MHRIDVHKLADESKFNRFHALVLFWGVLILILDGYDLAVVGAALPSIMKDMGVDATQAGFMASSALFGMMFGAIFLGTLADKIGRPLMISICVALFSVFTAAAGLTHDPVTFSVTRFLAGLGIGGVMPIVTAQMAEFAPHQDPRPPGDAGVRGLRGRWHPGRPDRQAADRDLRLAVGVLRRACAGCC